MKTFKITYFNQDVEIASIVTYHNVTNQDALTRTIANNIFALDYLPIVKATDSDGENYSKVVNYFVGLRLSELNK